MPPVDVTVFRLRPTQRDLARNLFHVMTEVFAEDREDLTDAYIDGLLARPDFWVLAAQADGRVIGGLTAYTLPLSRSAASEIFLYDLAVLPAYQRRGVARRLVAHLRASAAALGIADTFVAADNEDTHALDFYRAIGGRESPVTHFSFHPTPES